MSGDILNIAIDMDTGKLWFGKNGTYENSGDPAAGTGEVTSTLNGTIFPFVLLYATGTESGTMNYGQSTFDQTIPTGFLPINSANLTESTVKNGKKYLSSLRVSENCIAHLPLGNTVLIKSFLLF